MRKTWRGIVVAATLGLSACTHTSVQGTFHASGTTLTDWTMTPTDCASGDRSDFLGAQLTDGSGHVVTIVIDPTSGTAVEVSIPNTGKAVKLDATMCSTFDVDAQFNNTWVNNIRGVDGHVHVVCDQQGLDHFDGNAQFTCY
jgi:hypothetical protein